VVVFVTLMLVLLVVRVRLGRMSCWGYYSKFVCFLGMMLLVLVGAMAVWVIVRAGVIIDVFNVIRVVFVADWLWLRLGLLLVCKSCGASTWTIFQSLLHDFLNWSIR
jgi:hypothetical protein